MELGGLCRRSSCNAPLCGDAVTGPNGSHWPCIGSLAICWALVAQVLGLTLVMPIVAVLVTRLACTALLRLMLSVLSEMLSSVMPTENDGIIENNVRCP